MLGDGAHQVFRLLRLFLLFLPLKEKPRYLIHRAVTEKAQLHFVSCAGDRYYCRGVVKNRHHRLSRRKGGLFFFCHNRELKKGRAIKTPAPWVWISPDVTGSQQWP